MSYHAPPIIRTAERLMLAIERAVRRFPRYHKYTAGSEIRSAAMDCARLAHRAWRETGRQSHWLDQLVWSIDDLKLRMQLGQQIKAWGSLREYEHLVRIAKELGRQAGGWRKKHQSGQNPTPPSASGRAEILSSRTASVEAKS